MGMNAGGAIRCVSEVSTQEAWEELQGDEGAALVDVRSRAEWTFVGIPDLESLGRSALFVEWTDFPRKSVNPRFAETVADKLGPDTPGKLFFICRSGSRSLLAAQAVSDLLESRGIRAECVNVAEGFEGDLNTDGHRGQLNGWKFRGLAWRQS